MKPCERSRSEQFRDSAGATDERASLLSLCGRPVRADCIVIRGENAAAGKKVLQLFEKLQLTFSLQFLTQSIERAASERFCPPQFE